MQTERYEHHGQGRHLVRPSLLPQGAIHMPWEGGMRYHESDNNHLPEYGHSTPCRKQPQNDHVNEP